MSRAITVDDADDPRVADFRDLTVADRRPDRPGGRGLVIAEGVVVVRRLLASAYPPRAVLGVPRRLDELAPDLAGTDVPVYAASAEVMARIVGFHLNRGVLAAADRVSTPSPSALAARSRTVAVLEGIGDHENLGALFRNAAAFGVGGVLLAPGCADPLYRRSVRVSMGFVLHVPFCPLPDWPGGLDGLRAHGFRIIALTPTRRAISLSHTVSSGERYAFLLGAEGPGLSEAALAAADVCARIPMTGAVDSLNVATTAAIAFYTAGLTG